MVHDRGDNANSIDSKQNKTGWYRRDGLVLIFFGIFLIKLGKIIETVVELFLGALVVIYSINRLRNFKAENLIVIGLLLLALVCTFAYLLVF